MTSAEGKEILRKSNIRIPPLILGIAFLLIAINTESFVCGTIGIILLVVYMILRLIFPLEITPYESD